MQAPVVWRHLTRGDTPYIMKRLCNENEIRVVVSNLIHVWVHESTHSELLKICQQLNPLLECSDVTLIDKIWTVVDEVLEKQHDSLSCSVDVDVLDGGSLHLKFRTTMDGVAFKFSLKLIQESPLVFFKEVTKSILSSAEELLIRQDLLCSLLEKKDIEIEQYKLEGASLSRRIVETRPFVKEDFLSKPYLKECAPGLSKELISIISVVHSKSNIVSTSEGHCSREDQILSDQPAKKQPVSVVNISTRDEDKDASKNDMKPEIAANPSDLEVKHLQNSGNAVLKIPKPKRTKLNL